MTTATLAAFVAGLVAGLGVALPLGAIGVLLVQQGLLAGWRPAAAGATGVALVDLVYATVAVVAGSAVTAALAGHERAVRVVGAVILVLVAVRGLLGLRGGTPLPAPATAGDGGGTRQVAVGTAPGRVLLRFVGLTAVNPLTAVYFAVLAVGLGATVAGASRAAAFVVGVFLASWAWQLVLAAIGSTAGARLPAWARTATGLAGYLVVLGYAGRLAFTG